MIKKRYAFLMLGLFVMLAAGCSHKPKALHGIYYGYYSDGDPQKFLILAFSKEHPGTVGFSANYHYRKQDNVLKVTYLKNTVTLHGLNRSITLVISKNRDILTCLSCDGVNGPKTFSDLDNNGKRISENIADKAYKAISLYAKYGDNDPLYQIN